MMYKTSIDKRMPTILVTLSEIVIHIEVGMQNLEISNCKRPLFWSSKCEKICFQYPPKMCYFHYLEHSDHVAILQRSCISEAVFGIQHVHSVLP